MVSALIAVQRQPNTQIHPQAQRLPCGRRHQCCGRHRSTSSGRHCPPARHQGRLGTSHPSGTRLPPAPTHHHRNVVRHRTAHAQCRCSRSRRPSNCICMAGGDNRPSSPSPSATAPASCILAARYVLAAAAVRHAAAVHNGPRIALLHAGHGSARRLHPPCPVGAAGLLLLATRRCMLRHPAPLRRRRHVPVSGLDASSSATAAARASAASSAYAWCRRRAPTCRRIRPCQCHRR